jgi:hypothetical protein
MKIISGASSGNKKAASLRQKDSDGKPPNLFF